MKFDTYFLIRLFHLRQFLERFRKKYQHIFCVDSKLCHFKIFVHILQLDTDMFIGYQVKSLSLICRYLNLGSMREVNKTHSKPITIGTIYVLWFQRMRVILLLTTHIFNVTGSFCPHFYNRMNYNDVFKIKKEKLKTKFMIIIQSYLLYSISVSQ